MIKERNSIYSLSKERVRLTVSKKLPAGTNLHAISFSLIFVNIYRLCEWSLSLFYVIKNGSC